MLSKTFDPQSMDEKWQAAWAEADAFRTEPGPEETFCVMMPPPNVTGSLHMGHALNSTLQDIMTRYHRMRGYDALWQPGMDHAGIATQMVVERQLAGEGKTRHDLGRDAFIERVWKWREESGGAILNQLHRLGCSADWSRERFTMDEGLSAAVRKVFVDLHKQGLIYRDKRLVNWDCKLHTAISDLEVENREENGHLWYFQYPLESDPERTITVATTRPETMLGDTAVAVHPEDDRYRDIVGQQVVLPLVGRRIPIVADEYSDPEKGSGAVKITPAHDFNDFEVGARHGLPMINILDETGTLNDEVPEAYRGLDRFAARRRVVEDMEQAGRLEKIEDEVHTVPYGDRSGTAIEPWLTDQWFVDAATLAKPAIEAVESGRTRFVPEHWSKTYFEWMRNIQPWCISRQIWWGHRIPAWYGPDGTIFVEEDEEQAREAARAHYGEAVDLQQDTDVLDTWFSSGLWPFSTLGWPEQTPELQRYYPNTVLATAFDIIFFWVARMMMMGLHFMKDVPFHTVYIHALIRDEHGQKMSKTKGNVIDPLELINQYGADALRFTLTSMAAPGRDIKLSVSRVEGARNFATKIWNAARFIQMNTDTMPEEILAPDMLPPLGSADDRHIVARLHQLGREVDTHIREYRFNDMANGLYDFLWHQFCDWYIEAVKPVLNGDDEERKRATLKVIHYVFSQTLRWLHPIMPFVTEELWEGMGYGAHTGMLARGALPVPLSAEALGERAGVTVEEVEYVESKHEMIRMGRMLRSDYGLKPSQKVRFLVRPNDDRTARRLEADRDSICALMNADAIELDGDFVPERPMPSDVSPLGSVYMPVEGLLDIEAECRRLEEQRGKVEQDLERVGKKLANENFLEKAPPEVVQTQQDRKAELREKSTKLSRMIETLSGIAAG